MNARDPELLARYLDMKDEAAFSQLVEVYGGLVLGVARRVTGETESAKEAAQNTFLTLARKAPGLRGRDSLGGWLHNTAMLSARNLLRGRRREERKREALKASIEPPSGQEADDAWRAMQPVLDDSLASLPEKDREAVVLRFYRGCSVQEVATAMKLTLAAAQKRLSRALEKLRVSFQRRGVTLSVPALTGGLGVWMGESQAAAAFSAGWAATATALKVGSVGSSWTLTIILTAMTKSKVATAIVVAILLITGAAIAVNRINHSAGKDAASTERYESSRSQKGPAVQSEVEQRLSELEREYGSERMRQVRRIIGLLQASQNDELDMTMMALSMQSEGWVKQMQEKWGLGREEVVKLAELVAAFQDGWIKDIRNLYLDLGDRRKAHYAEALLLADLAAQGELSTEAFEEAYKRLSAVKLPKEPGEVMSAMGQIESYVMDKGFAADFEKLIDADRRSEFRQEVEASTQASVDSKLKYLKGRVPDLSDSQMEELRTFFRETRLSFPQRSSVQEFLTEAQNDSWREQAEAKRRQMKESPANLHTVGPNGETVVREVRPTRSAREGEVPAYPWRDLMTLEEMEEEARKLSKGGLISQGTGAGATRSP